MNAPTATDESLSDNETHWFDAPPKQRPRRAPASGPKPPGNPKLDSFEAVMEAMEAELRSSRTKSKPATNIRSPASQGLPQDKGKGRAIPRAEGKKDKRVRIAEDECGKEDIEAAMERELRAALDDNGDSDDEGQAPIDYNLIKNFLESFKGQGGASGPVSNLASRLQQGWMFPRDNES